MIYKNDPNRHTLSEIEKTLTFIRENTTGLIEKPGDSKWTAGHTTFAFPDDIQGMYTYMIGALKNGKVTWHIMPLYGVSEMREKWSAALEPFVSGKSCINFNNFDDLPQNALIDITHTGTGMFKKEMEAYYAKRQKKKK